MKTIELRSIVNGTNKEIDIPGDIQEIFNIWLKKRNHDVEPLEIFYAGYILANPIVREQYKNMDKINIRKS